MPWTTEDRFDIEARAPGNPTKADYRLMMQSLLADRFKLTVHYETRVVPLFELVLAKPGKFGPQLRLHRARRSGMRETCGPDMARLKRMRKDTLRPVGVRSG